MPRKKLSEYRAKTILAVAMGGSYEGIEVTVTDKGWKAALQGRLEGDLNYVVKVDQAVKGRFKKGLVELDVAPKDVAAVVGRLSKKGYTHLLVEPYHTHDPRQERYFALQRTREGIVLSFSDKGGIDIEAHPESVQRHELSRSGHSQAVLPPAIPGAFITAVIQVFDAAHISFLEINPLVITDDGQTLLLDAAAEVDDEAEFFADGAWRAGDLRSAADRTAYERAVDGLNDRSQASISLETINPDGSIFMLLSGGGASLVLADQLYVLGKGRELGNYGEYSGNPSAEETALYTEQIISMLLASKAPRKVLIIAGGVANFTDVRATFKGIIKALQARRQELAEAGVKVYVRRGGPHEKEGLEHMETFLKASGLLGAVCGPETLLPDIARQAVARLEND
ncbi:MAG TPA: ATP citrate lyase citrate-binding domain-containing protein [Candidatus Saccharimonadales bacterium]|jgi:succinyl-CoA synthetase beta subunit